MTQKKRAMTRGDRLCYSIGAALVLGTTLYAPNHRGEANVLQLHALQQLECTPSDNPVPFVRNCDALPGRCTTDSDCAKRFGGDGGPESARGER